MKEGGGQVGTNLADRRCFLDGARKYIKDINSLIFSIKIV